MTATSSTATTASAANWLTAIGDGSGSFRGVKFDLKGQQSQNGGRRTAKREFPLRENGGADDLGKRLREYTFNAVIVGVDYLSRRDALINALDAPGPGELVHPNLGTMQIQVDTWHCDEDTSSGGSADFSVTFMPPLDTSAPISTADAAAKTKSAAGTAADALNGDFSNGWSIDDLSLHDITAIVDNATAQINQITSSIQQAFGVLDDLSSIMSSASALQAALSGLIYEPAALVHQMNNLIGSVDGVANTAGQSFNAYKSMSDQMRYTSGTPDVLETTDSSGTPQPALVTQPSTAQGKTAVNQFNTMVSQLVTLQQTSSASAMLTEAITLNNKQGTRTGRKAAQLEVAAPVNLPSLAIQTSEDAQSITKELAGSLDVLTGLNSTFNWPMAEDYTRRLRLIFIADMTARGQILPGAITATTTTTEPALTFLNRITGNASEWAEFTRRNNIKNPLFLMPGDSFEVIANGNE
jgi:prophage DNA circulation protein